MIRWTVIFCGCLMISTAVAFWQTGSRPRQQAAGRLGPASGDVDVYEPRQVLRQPIRPIIEPSFISAGEADVLPNELVLGVEVDGAARAYPINQLTGPQREIINDVLGGTAIAATW